LELAGTELAGVEPEINQTYMHTCQSLSSPLQLIVFIHSFDLRSVGVQQLLLNLYTVRIIWQLVDSWLTHCCVALALTFSHVHAAGRMTRGEVIMVVLVVLLS